MSLTPAEILAEVQNTIEYERSQYAPDSGRNGYGDPEELDCLPELPAEAWRGLFGEYYDVVYIFYCPHSYIDHRR